MPERVPSVVFKTRVRDESIGGPNPYRWQDVKTEELFAGKKIVMFSLPGAFTPTCSAAHLPGYESMFEQFQAAGADDVYCVSVNDAFVMNQWARHLGVTKVKMIPDGNGEFTRGMDMMVKKENLGFGERSWRYSAYVDDGKIVKTFIEEGMGDNIESDPYEVSSAKTMLDWLTHR